MLDKDFLRQAIAEEEARPDRIEKERAEAISKLQQLKERFARKGTGSASDSLRPRNKTVSLFMARNPVRSCREACRNSD